MPCATCNPSNDAANTTVKKGIERRASNHFVVVFTRTIAQLTSENQGLVMWSVSKAQLISLFHLFFSCGS